MNPIIDLGEVRSLLRGTRSAHGEQRRLLYVCAAALVLSACITQDPGPSSRNVDGGSPSGSPGSSSEAPADAGSSVSPGDSSTPVDAGRNRSIVCDGKFVCTGDDSCCGGGDNDWIGAACKPAGCDGAYELLCDDASDCANGDVCCFMTDGGARATKSYCAASCRAEVKELQLCSVARSGECKTGSCTPLTEFSPNGLARCK